MCRRLIYFVLLLALVISSSVGAKTIIWVSDNKTPAGGVAADQGWVDLLVAQGYTVDLSFRNQEGRTLNATKIAALNAADLIIISRDTDSGNYDDGEEPTQWNSITKPILMQIAHIARNNRWRWLNTDGTNDSLPPAMEAVELNHYVFTGVTLGANNQVVNILTTNSSFANTTNAGNGKLIARRADNGQAWIVEWEAGQEFYAGSGQTAGGQRVLFCTGGTAGVSDGTYNLSAEGEKMFLNAVRYMLGEIETGKASEPSPANEATDLVRDVTLSWKPGEFAPPVNGHKVFLSENFTDVNEGIGGITQDANIYTPPQRLDFGKTYYWRVDEVNGPPDFTVHQGDVWSFTVEPVAYPIAGASITATASSQFNANTKPENTINGSGLDAGDLHSTAETGVWLSSMTGQQPTWIQYELDRVYKLHQMLVWNHNTSIEPVVGFGFKDATIEYSIDGANWAALGTTHEFARAPGAAGYAHNTTVDFGGTLAKYVKLTANSNWGGMVPQYGLSEVRFFYIPVSAREQNPASGSTDMSVENVTLSWRAGREAAKHNLYLSTDQQAVINETISSLISVPAGRSYVSYDTGELELDKSYYWKANEVNEAETPASWQGDVLNFSAQKYLVVDDFEDYNDFEPDRVFDTWIDGWNVPTNGSQVGYATPPFAEQTIIHGGKQSMPLSYDNSSTASYSEAAANIANLAIGRDWTKYGIKALSLYFYGDPNNSVTENMYVKLNGSKVTYDGDAANLTRRRWQQWNIELTSFGVNLRNVTELIIGFERSGAVGGKGKVYFDDVRLYPYSREFITPVEPNNAGLVGYWQFEGNTNDSAGANHGTATGGPTFVAGKIGQAINFDGVDDYVNCGTAASLDITGEITVACWIKVAAFTKSWETILAKGDNSYRMSRGPQTGNSIHFGCDGPTGGNVNGTAIVTDDTWHHVALVYDGSYKIIYIDGMEDARVASTGLINVSTYPLWIGNNSQQTVRQLIGLVDDVRIYSRALSLDEVAWLAGRTEPVEKPF